MVGRESQERCEPPTHILREKAGFSYTTAKNLLSGKMRVKVRHSRVKQRMLARQNGLDVLETEACRQGLPRRRQTRRGYSFAARLATTENATRMSGTTRRNGGVRLHVVCE